MNIFKKQILFPIEHLDFKFHLYNYVSFNNRSFSLRSFIAFLVKQKEETKTELIQIKNDLFDNIDFFFEHEFFHYFPNNIQKKFRNKIVLYFNENKDENNLEILFSNGVNISFFKKENNIIIKHYYTFEYKMDQLPFSIFPNN